MGQGFPAARYSSQNGKVAEFTFSGAGRQAGRPADASGRDHAAVRIGEQFARPRLAGFDVDRPELLPEAGQQLADATRSGFEQIERGFAGVSLPLFDAGRNESNLKLARVNREIAQAQYEKAIQSAFKEVSDALTTRATLMEQWSAQKSLTQVELDRVKLAQLRFQQGSISYLDALDAERAGFAAQQALIQIETQYTQNMVTLYRALGGGWSPAS